eukprot:COSAG01_NODE_51166_length_357_cov_0.550388_1_plen_78_part_10
MGWSGGGGWHVSAAVDKHILSISCVHGFMRADVPHMGAGMLVITDGQPQLAEGVASELGKEFFEFRGRTLPPYLSANA